MSAWRWAVAGLVAAALLFGVGWWIGHRGATSSDAERQAWADSTATLLGAAREAHLVQIAQLLREAEVDSAEARRLAVAAERERRERERWVAEADTLRAELAWAEHATDSLRIYPALVAATETALAHEVARGDSLEAGLRVAEKSIAVQRSVISLQDTRITTLEQQLRDAPKAERWRLRLLGADIRPALFAGVEPGGGVTVGVGVAITP